MRSRSCFMTLLLMHVELIAAEHDFARLQTEWDALAAGVPFRMHAWLHAWRRAAVVGSGRD